MDIYVRARARQCFLSTLSHFRLTRQPRVCRSSMSQHSDQGAGATDSSAWPSGAAAARAPAAPVANVSTITAGGILTVACVLVLFVILAFGLSSLQYCLDFRASRRRRGGAAVGNDGTTRGVDPELLRSLPVTVYRAAAKDSSADGAVGCAVCLAELEDGEEARFLPRCGHGFHAECVDMWLASHTTCPLCRLTVAKPDDMRPAPALALALHPVLHEPANYYASDLHTSVLLGVSDHQGAITAAATRVIDIPESAAQTTCDEAKSPGSARLRTIRRLWSFGRQGAGSSSSCSCAGGSERADVEQGIGVTISIAVVEAQLPSDTAADATRGAAA